MRFSLLYEIALPIELEQQGKTESDAFWEAIEQITYAEEMGFDGVWLVEHHFLEDLSRSSASEVFLSAIAQHTKKMRIGLGVCLMPTPYNHPFKVAEKVASLDIVSRGRVEWGCGRSTTAEELDGFGVDADKARAMMVESMTVVPQMWRQREFPGFKGEFCDLPRRVVVPKPVQKPHPPIWMACGSPTSYRMAGEMGVGCLSFTISAPEELKAALDTYRGGIADAKPVGDFINDNIAGFTTLFVDEDDEKACEVGGPNAVQHHTRVGRYYGNVQERDGYNERSVSVEGRIQATHTDHRTSIEQARMCIGGVDRVKGIIKRYADVGIDEFIGIAQFNHITHEQTMNTLRLMGEHVIPEYKEAREAVPAE